MTTPLVWPTDLVPQEQSFWHESNTLVMRSPISLTQVVQRRGPGRWKTTLTFTNADAATAARLDAILAALDGPAREVLICDFRRPRPRGSAAAYDGPPIPLSWPPGISWPAGLSWPSHMPATAPQLRIDHARAAEALDTEGWRAGDIVLRAGDYIGVNGTLHMVVDDVTANASSYAIIPIRPALRSAAVAGTAIVTQAPRARFRLRDAGVENPTRPGPFSNYTIGFDESLP